MIYHVILSFHVTMPARIVVSGPSESPRPALNCHTDLSVVRLSTNRHCDSSMAALHHRSSDSKYSLHCWSASGIAVGEMERWVQLTGRYSKQH